MRLISDKIFPGRVQSSTGLFNQSGLWITYMMWWVERLFLALSFRSHGLTDWPYDRSPIFISPGLWSVSYFYVRKTQVLPCTDYAAHIPALVHILLLGLRTVRDRAWLYPFRLRVHYPLVVRVTQGASLLLYPQKISGKETNIGSLFLVMVIISNI